MTFIEITWNENERFFQIQFQIFLTCKSWDTFQPMNAKIEIRRIDRGSTPRHERLMDVGVEFTVSSLSWSLSAVNFRLVVVWDKPENIGWVDFLCKRPII